VLPNDFTWQVLFWHLRNRLREPRDQHDLVVRTTREHATPPDVRLAHPRVAANWIGYMYRVMRRTRAKGSVYPCFARLRYWFLAWSLALLDLTASGFARADVSVSVEPAEVAICANVGATLSVIVRNSGKASVSDLALALAESSGVALEGAPAAFSSLPAGHAHIFSQQVLADKEDALFPGKVTFRLAYVEETKSRVAVATLDVKRRSTEAVAEVARLETKIAASTISDERPATGYVLVTNLSRHAITVIVDELSNPDLVFTPSERQFLDRGLGPGESAWRGFTVHARDRIGHPGKRTLVTTARVAWTDSGCARVGSLVSTQDLEVNVFSESQVLTAFGIPTFFVLPGFLAMVVWSLLWRFGMRFDSGKESFPIELKGVEFWFVAILISLLVAFVRSSFGRAYLEVYSLRDVMVAWFASVAGAAVLYVIVERPMTWSRQRNKAKEAREAAEADAALRARTPTNADKPLELLRRLALVGAPLSLPEYEHASGRCLEFPRDTPASDQWVFPPIRLELAGRAIALRGDVVRLREGRGHTVRELITAIGTCGGVTFEWANGGIPMPAKYDATALHGLQRDAPVIDAVVGE